MMQAYIAPSVVIQATAEISPMLNVQVNCAGSLYGSDDCKMAIADFEQQGGYYIYDGGNTITQKVAMNTRH